VLSRLTILLVALLAISAVSSAFAVQSVSASAPAHRFGFWLQEADVMKSPASSFFNAMFLTPPYPSSVEVMIFGIFQAHSTGQGCSTASGYIKQSISYWSQVATLANAYPSIRLVLDIAFIPNTPPYDVSCFNKMVQAFAPYSSIYGIGVEGEYTNPAHGLTSAVMQTAYNDVAATGKQFINYFIKTIPIPPGGYIIYHTNFPMQGDQVYTLTNGNSQISQTVGISSGYYGNFPFPSPFTCPIGTSAVATGAYTTKPQGYNQCVVSTELSAAVSLPAFERQFVEFVTGFSSNGSFTGMSGLSTNQLWDNPTLRNWIWTDPNYQGNFILSTA
jgi:hypothetical protein